MSKDSEFDAIIVGAGFAGIYQLKTLRDDLGLKCLVIDVASYVGGTWYDSDNNEIECDNPEFV